MKYTLTVDEVQADVILRALDFYSRVGCGQFNEISGIFRHDPRKKPSDPRLIHANVESLRQQLLQLSDGVAYSICDRRVPQDYRMAYEILQVIRNCKAWTEHPGGGPFVQFDPPFVTTDHPLCKAEAGSTREKLANERVSLAILAQVIGVETEDCPVLSQGYSELYDMAAQDVGWDTLHSAVLKRCAEHRDLLKGSK